jgi:hypothetical protein
MVKKKQGFVQVRALELGIQAGPSGEDRPLVLGRDWATVMGWVWLWEREVGWAGCALVFAVCD